MVAIVDKAKWPKFLKVVEDVNKIIPYNVHLSNPWRPGEMVKVVSYDEQENRVGEVTTEFRKRYVNVLRKDKDGKFTQHCNDVWKLFEPLNNKNV